MVVVAFLLSLIVSGVVLSVVPCEGVGERYEADYHYVPFAGDAFGA